VCLNTFSGMKVNLISILEGHEYKRLASGYQLTLCCTIGSSGSHKKCFKFELNDMSYRYTKNDFKQRRSMYFFFVKDIFILL